MYYLSSIPNTYQYNITDTTDWVTESLDKSEVTKLIKAGVVISGITIGSNDNIISNIHQHPVELDDLCARLWFFGFNCSIVNNSHIAMKGVYKPLVLDNLPKDIIEFGVDAFKNVSFIRSSTVDTRKLIIPDNRIFKSRNIKGISELVIGSNVKLADYCFMLTDFISVECGSVLSEGLFSRCDSLRRVILSKDIRRIPSRAFEYCYNLVDLDLPRIKTIGERAFIGTGLEYIDIPESCSNICSGAFKDCYNLREVTLRNKGSVKLGKNVFEGCISLCAIFCSRRTYRENWGRGLPLVMKEDL